MKKIEKTDIKNSHSTEDPLFLSYEGKLVGMIKLSDYNQWYPVFVNRSFKYNHETKESVANPEGISSIYITDIFDWATTKGFEVYSNA